MSAHYNQSYERKEIEDILKLIQECIRTGEYQISLNDKRQENQNFISDYNLRVEKQRAILLGIRVEDFCHSLQNTKPGFEHETLYVFVPQVSLFNADDKKELVAVYTKFNILEGREGNYTVVISFHKANKAAKYLFQRNK